jgi:hypothetical protein
MSGVPEFTVKTDSTNHHSPPILSWEEKKDFCNSLNRVKRRSILLTFPDPYNIGDVKSLDVIKRLVRETKTKKSFVDKVTVTEESSGKDNRGTREVKMAIKIQSKNAVLISGFIWKLYKNVFPKYDYRIHIDVSDTSVYLEKARSLVAPLQAREMDMDPFVFGESLYELLMRIENAMKGTWRPREIDDNWWRYPLELQRAVLESNRSWVYFIESKPYKALGETYPYTCRRAFDGISNSMPLPYPDEPCKEDALAVRRRESRERATQKIWDDLYDPVRSKRQKMGNMKRILTGNR